MHPTLDTAELMILIVIAAVISVVLSFMVANFGYNTAEKKVLTFASNTSTFDPVRAPTVQTFQNGDIITTPVTNEGCPGIIRTL